jgi:hypothetical protein
MGESGEEMNTLATILKSTILFLVVLGLMWVAGMEISNMVGHPIGHPLWVIGSTDLAKGTPPRPSMMSWPVWSNMVGLRGCLEHGESPAVWLGQSVLNEAEVSTATVFTGPDQVGGWKTDEGATIVGLILRALKGWLDLFSDSRLWSDGQDAYDQRDETEGCDMQQAIAIVIGATLIAGVSQSANAQCPPGAQIFIDPRLVPQRSHLSQEQMARILGSPWIEPGIKETLYKQYMMEYQPIEVPFRGGKVLISPTDPCIQQYIGQWRFGLLIRSFGRSEHKGRVSHNVW